MRAQFNRIQAYSVRDASRVLSEANRDSGFCSHIENPGGATWWIGSKDDVTSAIDQQIKKPVTVKLADGTTRNRKQRSDHRCLVAGVISWPDKVEWFYEKGPEVAERAAQLKKWLQDSLRWLRARFGDSLIAAVVHRDETYPHLHYFCVGDANQLHPGLRAEFVNGRRLKSFRDKQEKHKQALRQFLDDYHESVGSHVGLERHTGGKSKPRIKDRPTAMRVLLLERRMEEIGDADGLSQLATLRASFNTHRPPMRF